MSDRQRRWRIAIDFGTSNTAAVLSRSGEGQSRVVRLERDSDTMPSAVVVGDETQPSLAGRAAVNAMQVAPTRFIAHPKLLLGGTTEMIGGRHYKVSSLAGLTFAAVRKRALQVTDGVDLDEVVLTHPVAWGRRTMESLVEAAVKGGFDAAAIRTLAEPVAAARLYSHDDPPLPGQRVVVIDFGGGTLDVAIVKADAEAGFLVVGNDGDEHLGGKDFDDRLLAWVTARVVDSQGADAARILSDPANLRHQLALRQAVTLAKEDLSESQSAAIPIVFPGIDTVVTVTRGEYEGLIGSDVERAVVLARDLMAATSTQNADRVYLTGGSSRTPLLHQTLQRILGVRAATLFDPKLVVAEGALIGSTTVEAVSATLPRDELPLPQANDPSASPVVPVPAVPLIDDIPAVPAPSAPAGGGPPPSAPAGSAPGAPVPGVPGTSPVRPGTPLPQGQSAPPAYVPQSSPPRRFPWLIVWIIVGAASLVLLIAIALGVVSSMIGAQGTGQETPRETPVADAAECWDGSSAGSAEECPALEGRSALEWAFPLVGDFECVERTEPYIDGAVEGIECTWDDLSTATIVNITRFEPGEAAALWEETYADSSYTAASESTWTNGGELVGTSWVVTGGSEGEGERSTTLIYDDLPLTLDIWTRPSQGGDDATHEAAFARVSGLTLEQIALAVPSVR